MNKSKNTQILSTQDKLNTMSPIHQDFNFEAWCMAVREQMMSVLAHKGATLEQSSELKVGKLSQDRDDENLL